MYLAGILKANQRPGGRGQEGLRRDQQVAGELPQDVPGRLPSPRGPAAEVSALWRLLGYAASVWFVIKLQKTSAKAKMAHDLFIVTAKVRSRKEGGVR
jgi:hypothetical protein